MSILQAQSSTSLDQQGRAAYAAGDYGGAATAFNQAATQYQTENQPVRAALALANLSLSQQQLGQWPEAEATIAAALALVPEDASAPATVWASRGQLLTIQARLRVAQGNHSAAADLWGQAATTYQRANQPRETAQAYVSQARALQSAGFYDRAITQVQAALTVQPRDEITDEIMVDARRTYGDLLRLTGQKEAAKAQLDQALTLAQALALPSAISSVHSSLGLLAEAVGNPEEALTQYQAAAAVSAGTAPEPLGLAAQVSQLKVLVKGEDWAPVADLLPVLTAQLQTQPPNHETLYLHLTFAQTLLDLRQALDRALDQRQATTNAPGNKVTLESSAERTNISVGNAEIGGANSGNIEQPADSLVTDGLSGPGSLGAAALDDPLLRVVDTLPSGETIASLLLTTYHSAQTVPDIKAQIYALGGLGQLYSQTQQWDIAQQQTLAALSLAQGANLPDVEYQLQEQLCQILQNTDEQNSHEAIKACRAAVNSTNLLRNDLAAKGADAAFDFQQRVEPIYRNFIDLLLRTDVQDEAYQDNLREARQVLESLQLAELDNFFREACLEIQTVNLDDVIDQKTAVIYPIMLENRLEILLSLPDQIIHHSSLVSQAELDTVIKNWAAGIQFKKALTESRLGSPDSGQKTEELVPQFPSQDIRPLSQQLYQWLIQPLEADLALTDVDTLVFVLDGNLRNVSMAALYDGQRYLIEKYAVALTPGLQLIDPKPIARDSIQAFLAGVSAAQQEFSELPGVETELTSIGEIVGSKVLLNEQATSTALETGIATSSAPIVHLATHGKFDENLEDTFILTWQGKLNVNQLSQLLKTSELSRERQVELLILSACETAAGSERSVLGLAGVATRSGARSTLATLWAVYDTSTSELMSEFYRQLTATELTKAKALQQAQLKILHTPGFQHPFYWAPFILLGNWL
ncbi:CHAT domain-containing protein [Leptothoe sp. PORK10 BA2]|nr:CHAT domain-containing protein [Leptothoe sp. PORK10 BA2]